MANSSRSLGLPQILITFTSQAATAIARSARGIGAMILNDSSVTDTVKNFSIVDSTDIPSGIDDFNVDLIKKALLGTPSKVHVYLIPPATHEEEQTQTKVVETTVDGETVTDTAVETVTVTVNATITQSDALKKLADVRFNYICHPTGTNQDQQDLASWIKSQRKNRDRTCKAVVANHDADSYGVINFTTGGIKVDNAAYLDALAEVEGDTAQVDSSIPQYITYTATQYTARIMGILAGISLDRSATYYELPEVVECDSYEDIDGNINNGELCLFDEKDDNGVKIARGCNSLHTFTADVGQDFRFIKIVEGIDLIKDDIRDTFRNEYVGKVVNDYDNKVLFIAAISSYFNGIKGNVLDKSATASNYVEIDYDANYDYAKMHGADVTDMTKQQILEYNTGTQVFLRGKVTLANCMEDLKLNFTLS